MNKGDIGKIFVNQGWRDAQCLDVQGDKALVEYYMPAGSSALLEVPATWGLTGKTDWASGWGMQTRNIQVKRAPKRWHHALCIKKGEQS